MTSPAFPARPVFRRRLAACLAFALGLMGGQGLVCGQNRVLTGNEIIDVDDGETIAVIVSGTGGFTKKGVGILAIGGESASAGNTFEGNVTVEAGIIRFNGPTGALPYYTDSVKGPLGLQALPTVSYDDASRKMVTVHKGAAIDFNGSRGAYRYTIAGDGVGGTGALTNMGDRDVWTNVGNVNQLILAGNASIGGSKNWTMDSGWKPVDEHHAWQETGLELNDHTLTKTGSNTIRLTNTSINLANDAGGAIHIEEGILQIQEYYAPPPMDLIILDLQALVSS